MKRIVLSFIIGILCGVILLTSVWAHVQKKNFFTSLKSFFQSEESIEDHDMTLENQVLLGYTVSDFAEAILGDEKQLKKLEVYSRDVSDVVTLTEAGLGKIKAFSKYQYITYNGIATYTVDLSQLNDSSFHLDKDSKELTLTVPEPVLEPINIPSENIEFGDIEKNSIFAIGEMKVTPEDQAKVESEAKEKMINKLNEENVIEDAKNAAKYSIWDMFYPTVSSISPEYTLTIKFQ